MDSAFPRSKYSGDTKNDSISILDVFTKSELAGRNRLSEGFGQFGCLVSVLGLHVKQLKEEMI